MVVPYLYDYADLPQRSWIQLWAPVFALTGLLFTSGRPSLQQARPDWTGRLLAAFILIQFLSILWAVNRYEAFFHAVHWMTCGLLYALLRRYAGSSRNRALWQEAMLWGAAAVSVIGCLQFFFGFSWVPQNIGPAATFGNRNFGGQYVSLILPLAVLRTLAPQRSISRLVNILLAAMLLAYLGVSQTRGAWLAALLSLSFIALLPLRDLEIRRRWIPRTKRLAIVAGLALTATGAFLSFTQSKPLAEIGLLLKEQLRHSVPGEEGGTLYESTLDLRWVLWQNTLQMLRDRPLSGWGAGNFEIVYPRYHAAVETDRHFGEAFQPETAHNDFLQTGAESGVFAFLLLCALFLSGSYHSLRLSKSELPSEIRFTALAAGGGILALAVNSFFGAPLQKAFPPLVFVVFLSLLHGSSDDPLKGNSLSFDCRWLQGKRRAVLCLSVLFLGLCLLYANGRRLLGDAMYREAKVAEQLGDWESALQWSESSMTMNPYPFPTISLLGLAHLELGNVGRSVEFLEEAIEAHPYHLNAWINLGIARAKSGSTASSIEAFETALSIQPSNAKAHLNIGMLQMETGAFGEALDHLEAAAAVLPDASLWVNIGLLQLRQEQPERAVASFSQAVQLSPEKPILYHHLAVAHLRNGDPVQAWIQLESFLDRSFQAMAIDRTVPLMLSIGAALAEQGQENTALTVFHRVLRLQPGHVKATNNIGMLLMKTGRHPEALSYFQQVAGSKAATSVTYRNMGYLSVQMGKYEEAAAYLEKAVSLTPEEAVLHRDLAAVYRRIGEHRKAKEHLLRYRKSMHSHKD